MVHSTRSNKWYSLPVACLWSVVLSGYSGFFHHETWSPWYIWNIAENGEKTHKKEVSSCWFWISVNSFLVSTLILSQLDFIWILFAIMRSCYGIGTYDGMDWVDNIRLHRLIRAYPNIDESWKRPGPRGGGMCTWQDRRPDYPRARCWRLYCVVQLSLGLFYCP